MKRRCFLWIVYTKQAIKDIKNLKAAGLDQKAKSLIAIIKENPFQTPPAYEGLVGSLQGFYSRRINIQHRIVYQVYADETEEIRYEGTIKIVRMWTHYDIMMPGSRAPGSDTYGLFRATHFHNPTQYSHIVGLAPHFYAHIGAGHKAYSPPSCKHEVKKGF